MKIYCVRHGYAELEPNEQGERQLTEQGRKDVTKVAKYLAVRGFHVSHVMHSSKLRTQQTAQLFIDHAAMGVEPEVSPLLSPDAAVFPLIEQIQSWDDNTMLVGHMPFVSLLVSSLVVGSDTYNLARFTPGTIVCLERYENHRWIINWILRPDLVPENFL